MRTILGGYYRLLQFLLTALMALLIVPITMQILSRYTGVIPRFIWTEEIARFCFVWIVMIGSMIAVRDGTHFDVDLLPHSQNPTVELVAKLVVNFAILLMGLAFTRWGYDFGVLGSRQLSEIFGLPMITIYIAWPIAGVTWVIFILERSWNDIAAWRAA